MNFLRKINLYTLTPQFTVNKERSLSTNEGVITSLLFYILSAAIIIYNFHKNYYNMDPILTVYQDVRHSKEIDKIEFKEAVLNFNLNTFRNSNKNEKSYRYIKINEEELNNSFLKSYQIILDDNMNYRHFNLSKFTNNCAIKSKIDSSFTDTTFCTKFLTLNDIKKENPELFDQSNQTDFYDNFKKNEKVFSIDDKIMKLGGSLLDSFYYLSAKAKINLNCSNMNVTNRQNSDNLDNKLLSSANFDSCQNLADSFGLIYISISTNNKIVDKNNKTHGYQEYELSLTTNLNPSEEILVANIIYQKNIIRIDPDMLFSFENMNDIPFYEKRIQIHKSVKSNYISNNQLGIEVYYHIDDKVNYITRSYPKIDNVLANSFSVINIIFLVLSFVSSILNRNALEYQVINSLYYISRQKEKQINEIKTLSTKKTNISFNYQSKNCNQIDSDKIENEKDQNLNLSFDNKGSANEVIKGNKNTNQPHKRIAILNIKDSLSNDIVFDYFNFENGLKDLLKEICIFYRYTTKETKYREKLKKICLDLVSKELDYVDVISKMIQTENSFNKIFNESNEERQKQENDIKRDKKNSKLMRFNTFFNKNIIKSKRNLDEHIDKEDDGE